MKAVASFVSERLGGSPGSSAFRQHVAILRDQFLTAMGLARRGYFVPYSLAAKVGRTVGFYPAVAEQFEPREAEFASWLDHVETYLPSLRAINGEAGQIEAFWANVMFPPRDAAIAYAAVREIRPKRIVEIGSGNSTWLLAAAVADAGLDCTITCIDPAPRCPLDALGVRHHPRALEPEDEATAAALEPNDILFIDSSHIMLPGMDVDIEFNLLFPRLASGVVVHVHDIFLPYGYPWSDREYSEQNALIGWVVSGFFEVIFPGHFSTRHHPERWRALASGFAPLAKEDAGSLWLRRS